MPRYPQLLSARVEVTPYDDLSPDRYEFLSLNEAEPNLGASGEGNVLTMGANNTRVWTDAIVITSLSTTGNISSGNILTTGEISATGNITGNVANFADIILNNIDVGNIIGNGNIQVESLTSNTFVSATGNISGGNINTSGDISAAGNITAANFSATGNLNLGNLTVSNTTISTSLTDGNITLTPTGAALAVIDTDTGIVVPVGNTDQRPDPASTGTVRFNTDITRLEVYDGVSWEDIAANVTNQIINGDGITTIFTLDRASTAPATLVIINGVVQLPNVAYTITGNSLTMNQAPETTDVIDIRFL